MDENFTTSDRILKTIYVAMGYNFYSVSDINEHLVRGYAPIFTRKHLIVVLNRLFSRGYLRRKRLTKTKSLDSRRYKITEKGANRVKYLGSERRYNSSKNEVIIKEIEVPIEKHFKRTISPKERI